MRLEEIALDSGEKVLAFASDGFQAEGIEPIEEFDAGHALSDEALINVYHNEDLLELREVDTPADQKGQVIPISVLYSGPLNSISADVVFDTLGGDPRYAIPERFRTFAQGRIKQSTGLDIDISKDGIFPITGKDSTKPSKPFNGPAISTQHLEIKKHAAFMRLAPSSYFPFMALSQGMDVELAEFDDSFAPGLTLRQLEVVDGKAVGMHKSSTPNMLGTGFGLLAYSSSGDLYFVGGNKAPSSTLFPNTCDIIGGIPVIEGFRHSRFERAMKLHAKGKFNQELGLYLEGLKYIRSHLINEFATGPRVALLNTVITDVPLETIAEAYTSRGSQEHLTIMYAVPATLDAVLALPKTFKVSSGAQASRYLALQDMDTFQRAA